MELTQLLQFKAVAENNSISIASKQLHISQPALSTMIKKLENELGIRLFNHSKNKIVLNDAGKIVLKYANSIIEQSSALKKELEKYQQEYLKTKIGFCDPGPMWYCLPYFSSIMDKIYYDCYQIEIPEDDLIFGEIYDIIISSKPIDQLEIENIPLVEETMFLSVDQNHPLAKETKISLQDPRLKTLTRFYVGGHYTLKQANYWNYLKENLNINIIEDYFTFSQLLKDPNIITTTTKLVRHYRHDGNNRVLIPISDPQMKITYYLSYLKINQKKLQPYLDLLLDCVKDA
ncbi:LysR family transcriptional regulator [Thomasclavelia sp.]|uniref:LysR family transcriptional regulator n=1 Tax=Thomasclavelia sp. TaxID=3025757 RepID=UPI0025D8858A|nr:LysR family transcriptional regulator [Thomasclavelia sp.]